MAERQGRGRLIFGLNTVLQSWMISALQVKRVRWSSHLSRIEVMTSGHQGLWERTQWKLRNKKLIRKEIQTMLSWGSKAPESTLLGYCEIWWGTVKYSYVFYDTKCVLKIFLVVCGCMWVEEGICLYVCPCVCVCVSVLVCASMLESLCVCMCAHEHITGSSVSCGYLRALQTHSIKGTKNWPWWKEEPFQQEGQMTSREMGATDRVWQLKRKQGHQSSCLWEGK